MIQFDRFILSNGLRVIVHQDTSTPMAVMNIMYDVGARDEDPSQTGFAHLFEHLMFGGSVNILTTTNPSDGRWKTMRTLLTILLIIYPVTCRKPGDGFLAPKVTGCFHCLWRKSLDVQRKVVCEEFKNTTSPNPMVMCGTNPEAGILKHPYRWMTIGKELSHIENAKLEDVKISSLNTIARWMLATRCGRQCNDRTSESTCWKMVWWYSFRGKICTQPATGTRVKLHQNGAWK